MKNARTAALAALAALLLAAAPLPAQESPTVEPPPLADLLAGKAASIVNVKFVVKIQSPMGDEEANQEVRGALVDGSGLVMTASAHLDPSSAIMRMIPRQMRSQVNLKSSVTDLKVLFGNEEKEYEAQVVAKDSNLGLAFLQILELGDRKVEPVDLSRGADIAVGQELFGVSRLPRGFDCAPAIGRAFVTGRVEKPREMWSFSGDFAAVGMPVFDRFGNPVGVVSLQSGSEGAAGGGGGILSMLGGQGANHRPFILPAAKIARTLKAAKERGAQALEAARKAAEEKKAAEEEPGEEKPGAEKPGEEKPGEEKPGGEKPPAGGGK